MIKIKMLIWITLSGGLEIINTWATIKRLSNNRYELHFIDGESYTMCAKFDHTHRFFYDD
jgi:hypothetical protein